MDSEILRARICFAVLKKRQAEVSLDHKGAVKFSSETKDHLAHRSQQWPGVHVHFRS